MGWTPVNESTGEHEYEINGCLPHSRLSGELRLALREPPQGVHVRCFVVRHITFQQDTNKWLCSEEINPKGRNLSYYCSTTAYLLETWQEVSGRRDGVVWVAKPGQVAGLYQIHLHTAFRFESCAKQAPGC